MSRNAVLAVLAALAPACGSSPPAGPDAGPAADAAPPRVGVRVNYLVNPTIGGAGTSVIFSNPDGSVASVAQTDDHGFAYGELPQGGSVTAVQDMLAADGGPIFLDTLVGVQPQDFVDLTLRGAVNGCGAGYDVNVSVPSYPGAASYRVTSDLETVDLGAATKGVLSLGPCDDWPVTLTAIALDDQGHAIASATYASVPMQTGGGTWVPPDVAMPAWTAAGAFGVHLTHVPAGRIVDMHRVMMAYDAFGSAAGSTIDITLPDVPAWENAFMRTVAWDADGGHVEVLDPIAGDATSYALDLASVPDATLSIDLAGRAVAVHASSPGTESALVLHFQGATASKAPLHWYVAAAPDATSVTVPSLPASFTAYDLVATATAKPAALLVANQNMADWPSHHGTVLPLLLHTLNGHFQTTRSTLVVAP